MASRVEYLKPFLIPLSIFVFSCLEATRLIDIPVKGGHRNLTLTLKEKIELNFYFVDGLRGSQNITVYVQHRRPGETVFDTKCILKYSRDNCSSTTTLCRCLGQPLANYRINKVFTQDDAGTWLVTPWNAQNPVKETVDIIVEENTRKSTFSTVIIAVVSLVIVVAVVTLSFLFLWYWSRRFVKTVLLVVMASADTPSDCFQKESALELRNSRDIFNVNPRTLSAAALPEPTIAPPEPTIAVTEPEIAVPEPAIAVPEPATALLDPALALPELIRDLPEPAKALPEPSPTFHESTTEVPESTTLPEPATELPEPVALLLLPELTEQPSTLAIAQSPEHARPSSPPAPPPTKTLSPQALPKVPPPTPPKPPPATTSTKSASAPQPLPPPAPALSTQALPKVPPPTPPKPPPATTSKESASAPQPPPSTTSESTQGSLTASSDLNPPIKVCFSV